MSDHQTTGRLSLKFKSGHLDIIIATCLINLFALTMPLIMMQVYDRILFNKSLNTLKWLVVGGLLALFIESIVKYIRDCISALLSARFEHNTECDVVSAMLTSRLEVFEKETKDSHLETLQGISKLCRFYSGQFYQVLFDFPFAFIFLLAIYFLGGVIVLFPLTLGVVYLLILLFLRKNFKALTDKNQERYNLKYRYIAGLLDRIPTIKSMSMEEQLLRRYENYQLKHAQSVLEEGAYKNLPSHLGAFFSQMAMYGTILIGGTQVIDGSMTIGALTACMLLSTRAFQPIQSASSFLYNFSTAKQYHERMDKVLSMPSEISKGAKEFPKEIQGRIKTENLSFRWSKDSDFIVSDLNLDISANQVIGIRGGAMSGTTTLLYLLMGKLQPETGKVYIGGEDLSEVQHDKTLGKIEFLSSEPNLITGTILENITLFNSGLHSVAKHTAHMIGLDQMVAPLPLGYETKVNPKSGQYLPAALVHCICLARILVIRPRVLVLDKVTMSMDKETENLFLEVIELLKSNCTVIFATNWPVFLAKCDKVYSLEGGAVQSSDFAEKVAK